ncbi:hypothetical protein JTB14_026160 [Gonioctena quinquepunctata]|nr:hypothetical protein JTB14_026160 [Gonioctena quinquepunctata]
MDKWEEEKLLCWYDDNIESEHDPFSDDGEFSGDSDYAPLSEEDNDEVIFPITETGGETQDNSNEDNVDNNFQENQSSTENDDWVSREALLLINMCPSTC